MEIDDVLPLDAGERRLVRRIAVRMLPSKECGPEIRCHGALRIVFGRPRGVHRRESSLRTSFSVNAGFNTASARRSRPRSKSFCRNSAVTVVAEPSCPSRAPAVKAPPRKSSSSANCSAVRLAVPRRNKLAATLESPAICEGSDSTPPLISTRKCTRGTPLRAIIATAAPLGRVSRVYGGSLACPKPRDAATASSRMVFIGLFALLGRVGGMDSGINVATVRFFSTKYFFATR